jgi:hypothetical protein
MVKIIGRNGRTDSRSNTKVLKKPAPDPKLIIYDTSRYMHCHKFNSNLQKLQKGETHDT